MKKLITFMVILISFGSMAQTTNSINGVKYPYIKEEKKITKVTFPSLKITLDVEGSNAVSAVTTALKNYLSSQATAPPVITPTKPVYSPPVGVYVNYTLTGNKQIDLADIVGKSIKFKPGEYKGIYLYSSKPLKDVIYDFSEVKCYDCSFDLPDGNNVKIYGLESINNSGRAIKFSYGLNNFQLYNIKFTNCNVDYSVASEGMADFPKVNTGFKLINCTFDNSGAVALFGQRENNIDKGVFKDAEIAYNTFKNSSPGKLVEMGNAWDYNVHDNFGTNLNATNNNHNGLFELQGNGKFYNNNFQNYQGNSIRAWLFSRGEIPAFVEIYNNVCYNTRKYGAFEIQQFARHITPGISTFANAKVYNNTVGLMNTSKDWEGQILDLYNFGGSLEFYNNLGFNLNRVSGSISDMINYNGNSTPGVKPVGNVYKALMADAVDLNLRSKIARIGAQ